MWTDTDSDDDGWDGDDTADESWDQDEADAYWRRRFLILCAGVVALGLCAWLFPGARHSAPRTSAPQALPAAAYGKAWTPTSSPTPAATASRARPTASATAKSVRK